MALQTKVNGVQVAGIVGEFSDASPKSGRAYIVYGKGASDDPIFGKFFSIKDATVDSAASSEKKTVAIMGHNSTSWSMGILVNPKEHYTNGFVSVKTMVRGGVGTIATRGHIWVMASTTTVAGEPVYVDADGNLGDSTLASSTKVLGAKWLKSVALASGKTEVLSEIAIDNPTLNNESGPSSL